MFERQYECPYCKATGIYVGTLEPPGVGVVCRVCRGSGHISFSVFVTPLFTQRKRRDNVSWVYLKIDPKHYKHVGKGVSVDDFYNGIMPTAD
jgi:hypothetical protein